MDSSNLKIQADYGVSNLKTRTNFMSFQSPKHEAVHMITKSQMRANQIECENLKHR